MTPERFQLSRRPGFRLPPNTVSVARPSRWGNPFHIVGHVVGCFMDHWTVEGPGSFETIGPFSKPDALLAAVRLYALHVAPETDYTDLRGLNVACYCPLGSWCHGDVILACAHPED